MNSYYLLDDLTREYTTDSSIRIGRIDNRDEAVIEPAFNGATFAGQLALVQKTNSSGAHKPKREGNFGKKKKKKHRKGKRGVK